MKIQILYSDKRGGHCVVAEVPQSDTLLEQLAKRKVEATILHGETGKRIGAVFGAAADDRWHWGYAL